MIEQDRRKGIFSPILFCGPEKKMKTAYESETEEINFNFFIP